MQSRSYPSAYQLTHRQTDKSVPYLQLAPERVSQNSPTVLILHGLGRNKEHMLPVMYAFAQAGFTAVGIDIRLHGEQPQAEERDRLLNTSYIETMYHMTVETGRDISHLLDFLQLSQAGIYGLSLGGIVTLAAMIQEPRLAVAVCAMGTPDWGGIILEMGITPDDPLYQMVARQSPLEFAAQTYPPRPLLLLHGDQDDVVPIAGVLALQERLEPVYRTMPDRLVLEIFQGLGHQHTPEMVALGVAWITRFMGEQNVSA